MDSEKTITKAHLEKAFEQWVNDYRTGKTRTQSETSALPPPQIAKECADTLWALLDSPTTTTNMSI